MTSPVTMAVTMPGRDLVDWSAVTSETAREALRAIVAVFGVETKWRGLSAPEERVRRAVLALYRRLGRAPDGTEIAAESGLPSGDVAGALVRLEGRDIVCLDADSGAIAGAYPFTERASGHRVALGG